MEPSIVDVVPTPTVVILSFIGVVDVFKCYYSRFKSLFSSFTSSFWRLKPIFIFDSLFIDFGIFISNFLGIFKYRALAKLYTLLTFLGDKTIYLIILKRSSCISLQTYVPRPDCFFYLLLVKLFVYNFYMS